MKVRRLWINKILKCTYFSYLSMKWQNQPLEPCFFWMAKLLLISRCPTKKRQQQSVLNWPGRCNFEYNLRVHYRFFSDIQITFIVSRCYLLCPTAHYYPNNFDGFYIIFIWYILLVTPVYVAIGRKFWFRLTLISWALPRNVSDRVRNILTQIVKDALCCK